MNSRPAWLLAILLIFAGSCRDPEDKVVIPEPEKLSYGADSLQLSPEKLQDKILGALAGSAIGDAMGASTEMWYRDDIRRNYGYITGLTPAVRPQSPEGTWEHNLGAGATTDDTRWKYFMVRYFSRYGSNAGPGDFADFIIDYYRSVAGNLGEAELLENPDAIAGKLEKVDWILEWARVAIAYREGADSYTRAVNRFYGGEMACAGMLYAPMFGLVASGAEDAYQRAYEHSLFDHGYAKDITGLVAGMTQMALQTDQMDSILNTSVFVDPLRYQDSRLVGRISLDMARAAREQVRLSREIRDTTVLAVAPFQSVLQPIQYPGTRQEWIQQQFIYAFLEQHQKAIPFHAGEIWQILIAALEFGQGDFEKTIQFIVNYGRDNDTVAAIAGMIMGAKLGYSGLPEDLREEVVRVNRQQLGIDLEALASELTASLHYANPQTDDTP